MKKNEWFSLGKIKKISKNQLLIGGLCGVLLLLIAIPTPGDSQQKDEILEKETETSGEMPADSYQKKLERELKQVLEKMEGVGKVEVMITLQDEGERVVEKDLSKVSQETIEGEGEGKRETSEHQVQEETVFSQGNDGEPFVSKETAPCVEGVLVVAEGGGDSKVAKNISDAVLALFPVELHKIKVVKMN